jgi:hypothetical protein
MGADLADLTGERIPVVPGGVMMGLLSGLRRLAQVDDHPASGISDGDPLVQGHRRMVGVASGDPAEDRGGHPAQRGRMLDFRAERAVAVDQHDPLWCDLDHPEGAADSRLEPHQALSDLLDRQH